MKKGSSTVGKELSEFLGTDRWEYLLEDEFILFERVGEFLLCIYKDFPVLNLEVAQKVAETRRIAIEMMGQEKVFLFVDMSQVKKSTTEARDFFDKPEETKAFAAMALYTESLLAYVVGTFYLKFTKFKGVYQQIFFDKKKACQWLEKEVITGKYAPVSKVA